MRKVFYLALLLCLVASLSCTSAPKVDTQLQEQVQREANEFKKIMDEIAKTESSIKYSADFPLRELIPKDWLYEISEPTGKEVQVYLGVPIPKDIGRGMISTKSDNQTIWFSRGGILDPDTDKYVVSTYSGTAKLAFDITSKSDWLQYPKLLTVDYLKGHKISQSPYYIPMEATHGVYRMTGPEYRRSRVEYSISQNLSDLSEANPYTGKSSIEVNDLSKLTDAVKRFKEQIAAMKKDIGNAGSFIEAIESRYSKTFAESWNVQEAVKNFKNLVDDNTSKCSQLEAYLDKINTWDYSNLKKLHTIKSN